MHPLPVHVLRDDVYVLKHDVHVLKDDVQDALLDDASQPAADIQQHILNMGFKIAIPGKLYP